MFILSLLNQIKNLLLQIWDCRAVKCLVVSVFTFVLVGMTAVSSAESMVSRGTITVSDEVGAIITDLNTFCNTIQGKSNQGSKDNNQNNSSDSGDTHDDHGDASTTQALEMDGSKEVQVQTLSNIQSDSAGMASPEEGSNSKDGGESPSDEKSATERSEGEEKGDETAVGMMDNSGSGSDMNSNTNGGTDTSSNTNTSTNSSSTKSQKATYSPATAAVTIVQVLGASLVPGLVIYLLYKRFTNDNVKALPILYTGDVGGLLDEEH